MNLRNKISKKYTNYKYINNCLNPQDKENELNAFPLIDRTIEKYINIGVDGWQERYYRELFNIEINEERKKQICINYLEGLDWNFKYYTQDCPNWKWKYKYNYPPLLQDQLTLRTNPSNHLHYDSMESHLNELIDLNHEQQ